MKGEPYTHDVEAHDPDRGDELAFSLDAAPNGMTIDAASGLLSWTSTQDQRGENEVRVRVKDQGGLFDTQAFKITVASQDVDLTISSIDASSLAFDGQALTVSGNITAKITNNGPEGVVIPVDVLFFEDVDFNGSYDANIDNALGRANVTESLSSGASVTVTAALSGSVRFSGAPIWGYVDSEKRIPETDEENNLSRSGSGCQVVPHVGVIDPVLEWSWTSSEVEPDALNVMITPCVVDITEDGVPDVIFISAAYTGSGVDSAFLRALNGNDGSEIFTINNPAHKVSYHSSMAVGDIDNDGLPEIIVRRDNYTQLIAFENDGTFKWLSDSIEYAPIDSISIADLDHDGTPNIVVGRQALDHLGKMIWTGIGGKGSNGIHPNRLITSLVADINLDGSPDVVAGNTIYNADGSIQMRFSLRDGYNAVANFDDDVFPEIVLVSEGHVYLLGYNGSIKWGPVSIPGGGLGGPPTIADFDNDGEVEIGVAGAIRYVVYETDGSIKWESVISDRSSSRTGSSVFDFDGDGSAEVVYRDELYLRIYRGTDGTILFRTPMSSCTAIEYVLVADVDADGNAEIVAVANNNCGYGPQRGVFVYGSASDSWVSTRKIWNQHSYHITNVNDDGTIPIREKNNWETYNNYRQNILPEISGLYDAPDLIPSYVQVSEGGSSFTISARIGNAGVVTVGPGVSVGFYDGDPKSGGTLLGTTKTTAYIDPGTYEDVSFTVTSGIIQNLFVSADDDGTLTGSVSECNELNNIYDMGEGSIVPRTNHPPEIISEAIITATRDEQYQYDVEATDADDDGLTYSLVTFPENMTINAATGIIEWVPNGDQVGNHEVMVRVEDGKGGSDSQTFTITVTGGTTTNLTVSIQAVPASIIVGGSSTLTWSSTNATSAEINQGIGGVDVNGSREVSPTETTTYTIIVTGDEGTASASATVVVSSTITVPDVIGMSQAEAEAAIAAAGLVVGNITEMSTTDVPQGRVFNQNPRGGSVVSAHDAVDISISLGIITTDPKVTLISPEPHADIKSPTDIIATITDPDPLDLTWETRFAPVGTEDFRVIGSGVGTVDAAPVGRFDPTLLANDTYRVEINWKKGPKTGGIFFYYSVSGNLKVGNFRLEFVDLQIPLAGIPITIKRVYDTLDLRKGDFGVGWTLGYPGAVRDSVPQGQAFSLRSRVYVTMPDGRRIGFKFAPVQVSPWFPFIFRTAFAPDPGVYDKLSVDEAYVMHSAGYFYTGLFADNFNPSQYTLTTEDGAKYVLHEQDGLLRVEDLNGNILTVEETGITHSSGTTISFVRDSEDRIQEIIDPDGHSIHYTYDAIGDLVSVTNREGAITTFTYFSQLAHFLDRIIDPLGNVGIRSEYDENGRIIAIYDADGNRISVNHSLADSQEIITDARGNKTIVVYDNRGNVISETNALGETTLNTYDEEGNLLSRTNPAGETIQFTYDDRGNALSRTDDMGNKTQYDYNSFGQPTSITDPAGNVYTFQYDTSGNLIRRGEPTGSEFVYEYDSHGNMTKETDTLGFATLFQYDSAGNQISRIDPLGNKSTFTYDSLGNRTSKTRIRTDANGVKQTITTQSQYDTEGRLIRTTDPAGNVETFTHDQSGKLTEHRDKRGVVATHTYDVRGNKIRTEYDDGSFETAEYDEANNLLRQRDRNGNVQTFEYNAVNRVTHAVDPMGRENDREYDAAGRINALILSGIRSEIEHDSGRVFSKSLSIDDPIATRPRITKITFEDGLTTNLGYDQNGNITDFASSDGKNMSITFTQDNIAKQFVTADGTTTRIDFDAKSQPRAMTNPGGVDYTFTLDALGRITDAVDPLGGHTIYTYDEIGNKLSQTDANGNTTRWEYDNSGKVTRRTLPEGMSERFVYNQVGDMIEHTDFNGARTTFQYDTQGRIILKECSDGTSTQFNYDNEGRLTSVRDGRGTMNYQYDSYGRNTRVDLPEGSFIAYAYDERANRSSMTTPSGTTRYTYDPLSRIQSITDISGGVTQYRYDDGARTTTIARPNGTRSITTRDGEGRTVTLIHSNAAGDVLNRYDVTYDEPNGHRVIRENTGRTVTYFYDELHRLTREQIVDPVNGNETISYTYDAVGNRLTMTDATGVIRYVYDRNNRLLSAGNVTYSYDRNGNSTGKDGSDGHWTFVYDCDNRLTRVVSPVGVTSAYSYDHDGARIASIENGVRTQFLIDKNVRFHQVVTDLDEANNPLVHYTYNDTQILSRKQLSGGESYYLEDPLQSIRQLTDAGGGITDTYRYDTFGRNLQTQESTPNRYRYLSEENDVATDLVYLRARYLDPETGRFLGVDPVQGYAHDPRSQHPYMYGFNDPTSFFDRSGNNVILQYNIQQQILLQQLEWMTGLGFAFNAVFGSLGSKIGAHTVLATGRKTHDLSATTFNFVKTYGGIGGVGVSGSLDILRMPHTEYVSFGFVFEFSPYTLPYSFSISQTLGGVYNVFELKDYEGLFFEGSLQLFGLAWSYAVSLPNKMGVRTASISSGFVLPTSSFSISWAVRNYWIH